MLRAARLSQGDGFRIIYVHVPAAWLSLMVYVVMAAERRGRTDLAHEGGPRGGRELRADRGLLHRSWRW